MAAVKSSDPLVTMFIQMNRDLFLSEKCKQCWLKFHTYFFRINSCVST